MNATGSLTRPASAPYDDRMRLALILAMLLWTASAPAFGADDPLVRIMTPNGMTVMAEVADTPLKRAQGLMFRDSLAPERGMLFIFTEPQLWSFWMKNTRISLDIVWLDQKKKVVDVAAHVPICMRTDDSCPQYQPSREATYVLEVPAGMAEALKLQKGAAVKFNLNESTVR